MTVVGVLCLSFMLEEMREAHLMQNLWTCKPIEGECLTLSSLHLIHHSPHFSHKFFNECVPLLTLTIFIKAQFLSVTIPNISDNWTTKIINRLSSGCFSSMISCHFTTFTVYRMTQVC